VVLTGGYAYAYWLLGKLKNRQQGILHLSLLTISLIILLATTASWSAPLIPDTSWRPQNNDFPLWDILRILGAAIGVPFLLLAANSTLTQAWFHRDNPKPTPYRLYALSNTGSLLALITYPILIEPYLTLRTQTYLWTGGYFIFALMAAFLAIQTFRLATNVETLPRANVSEKRPEKRAYVFWITLAALATILLVAVTNQITQEVAVIPFLWVLPLIIYLLTFILAFAGEKFYWRNGYIVAFFVLTIFSRMLLSIPTRNITVQLTIYMLLLFVCCMICHNELYKLRPHAQFLPSFYLMVALGGALGGIFVTLIAPLLFSSGFWELQLALIATIVMLAVIIQLEPKKQSRKKSGKAKAPKEKPWQVLERVVMVIMVLALLQTVYTIYYVGQISANTLAAERNFYGVLRVWEINEAVPELLAHQMTHGQTTHGFQFQPEAIRDLPTTYYSENSGVGLALLNHPKREEGLRVGALGLGIGVIASYGQADDMFRFYEINPDVIELAEGNGRVF
jgi:MFS family permease